MSAISTLAPESESRGTKATDRIRLFSGSANLGLAEEIGSYMGIDLGGITRKKFADGEIYIQVQDSIRGCDVYLIQPTCQPVNDHLMELLIMVDACRRASARQITAVLPYYGYARADRKVAGREAIAAKLTANILTQAGVDRVLALDLHSQQIQGYFDIPIDHLFGAPVIIDYLLEKNILDMVVVSPDIGGVARARAFAKNLNGAPLAIIDKRRHAHNEAEVMNVIGNINGKNAIVIDDIIDTAGTITKCAKALRQAGAKRVYACATHAVFSPPAIQKLSEDLFEEIIVTNTIPVPENHQFERLTILSVAKLLGEAISRIHQENSMSTIFKYS